MKKRLLIFFLVIAHCLQSQVVFQFAPEINGRNVDGLLSVRISSMLTQKQPVSLTISVAERKSGKILFIKTAPFDLLPGSNMLPRIASSSAIIQFAETQAARLTRQSAYFPEGEYEYCFQMINEDKHSSMDILGEQCFSYLLEPLSPLFLIDPYQNDKICDKRPLFTWQPSLPAIPGMLYRLTLVEKKDNQAATEALHYNLPLINQSGISTPILVFPPSARELEEGKKYIWQVTSYKNDMILTRSEIWEFSVQCNDSVPKETYDGFRDIEDLVKGNFYIANGRILFSLRNPYERKALSYSIECLNNPDLKIKKLPEVILKRGENNIVIELPEGKSFIDGYNYVLKVALPDRSIKKLRFLYKHKI